MILLGWIVLFCAQTAWVFTMWLWHSELYRTEFMVRRYI